MINLYLIEDDLAKRRYLAALLKELNSRRDNKHFQNGFGTAVATAYRDPGLLEAALRGCFKTVDDAPASSGG